MSMGTSEHSTFTKQGKCYTEIEPCSRCLIHFEDCSEIIPEMLEGFSIYSNPGLVVYQVQFLTRLPLQERHVQRMELSSFLFTS